MTGPAASMSESTDRFSSCGHYVSKKVSRVRWQPTEHPWASERSPAFVCGTWDDPANGIEWWQFQAETAGRQQMLRHARLPIRGDVQGLQFLSASHLGVASSLGHVQLIQMHQSQPMEREGGQLTSVAEWSAVHGPRPFAGPAMACTGLATGDQQVATCGEDGSVALMDVERSGQVARRIEGVDSSSLTDLLYFQPSVLLVTNVRGQMKLVDTRSASAPGGPTSKPTLVFGEPIRINSIDQHATQPHIICSGMETGAIAFWDLRGQIHPITILKGHAQSAVSEVKFHPQQPEHVFSCSQRGEIWHWNGTDAARPTVSSGAASTNSIDKCLWFNNEALKHRVNTEALMQAQYLPINSLDASGPNVVVGGDSEAIYVMSNVII